jgi:aldose sugar dehydrogenase
MIRPRNIFLSLALFTAVGMACNRPADQRETGQMAATENECQPLETREPNVPEQRPAFPGQTRACAITTQAAYQVEVLATGLVHPWAVAPLPDGSLLVTEKPGRLRLISQAGEMGEPITGLPAVDAKGQGGLLDVTPSPDFGSNRTIFWTFAEPRTGGNGTSVARGVLSADGRRVEQVRVIFRAMPTYDGDKHFGSRIVFGADGNLFVTTGERSDKEMRPQAQQMDSHMGKLLRITPDGATAPGNPFIGQEGTQPEIWTVGHRNVQAAAFDPKGRLWTVDMGPQGGDELNLIEKGKNYGWPLVTYGEEYSGEPIPGAVTQREGFEQPRYFWDPVISPSGAQFYTGDAFPEWRGNLFVGGLTYKQLVRLQIECDRVTGVEHLLDDRGQRIRDVKQGPDGALYVVTDESKGELWKISPGNGVQ